MPLLSNRTVNLYTNFVIFESPEARAISGRYINENEILY
jgi:hypothetical protein